MADRPAPGQPTAPDQPLDQQLVNALYLKASAFGEDNRVAGYIAGLLEQTISTRPDRVLDEAEILREEAISAATTIGEILRHEFAGLRELHSIAAAKAAVYKPPSPPWPASKDEMVAHLRALGDGHSMIGRPVATQHLDDLAVIHVNDHRENQPALSHIHLTPPAETAGKVGE